MTIIPDSTSAESTKPNLAAYVINLPTSTERREKMEMQLSVMKLPYEIFTAVNGNTEWLSLRETINTLAFCRNTGREVMAGEIGCYHSHLMVWKDFLAGPAEVALVMEDDVVFHPEFMSALDVSLKVMARWDFLKLNKIRAKQPICQGMIGKWKLNAYLGPATGLGAYLITRELANRLLPRMLPITRPIDHELDRVNFHDFRHFGLEPFPSHVDDGNESTITGTRFSAVKKFPWYRRIPAYLLRLGNFIGKTIHLARRGRLVPNSRVLYR